MGRGVLAETHRAPKKQWLRYRGARPEQSRRALAITMLTLHRLRFLPFAIRYLLFALATGISSDL